MPIVILRNDITNMRCDAIVNPANSSGTMGGGVAAALKNAGGIEIEIEAMKAAPIPVGKAVATTAGKLHAKYVIHAPTMEKSSEKIGPENVKAATKAALELAKKLKVKSIAFPGMGMGTGGAHPHMAVRIMLDEMKKHPEFEVLLIAHNDDVEKAFFCEYGRKDYYGVIALLKRGDKILIMKRSDKVSGYPGYYHCIAGHLEEGNDPLEMAMQEVEEEAQIPRSKIRLLAKAESREDHRYGITFIRHMYLFETEVAEVKLNWENTDARWIRPGDLGKFKYVPFLKEALEAFGLV